MSIFPPAGWQKIRSLVADCCWEFLDFKGMYSICNYGRAVIGCRFSGKFNLGKYFSAITLNDDREQRWFLEKQSAINWLIKKMEKISKDNYIDSPQTLKKKLKIKLQSKISFFFREIKY